nr:hypothetical protein [Cellulosimicrobium sp. MM]
MIDDYCEVHMTHHPTHPTVLAVSGNPRPGSRTLGAAETVARRVADLLGADDVATGRPGVARRRGARRRPSGGRRRP